MEIGELSGLMKGDGMKKMELKIMTWNIKGEASLGWNNDYKINSKVVDKVIDQKADIIVLTAFVVAKGVEYLFERLQKEGYIWFISNRSGKSGILVAAKKGILVGEKKLKDFINDEIYYGNAISSVMEGCNVLQVSLPLIRDKVLNVVGCRMETGGFKCLQDQYDFERKVFDEVLLPALNYHNNLQKSNLYIVCGDFNNARCLGNLNKNFCMNDYNGKAQCNYNLNVIKDSFEKLGLVMADIDKNGKAISTHNGYIPDDHIFVHGGSCKECLVVPSEGLSDHDIVVATVQILDSDVDTFQ